MVFSGWCSGDIGDLVEEMSWPQTVPWSWERAELGGRWGPCLGAELEAQERERAGASLEKDRISSPVAEEPAAQAGRYGRRVSPGGGGFQERG